MTFNEIHRVCKTTIQGLAHVKDLQSYNAKGRSNDSTLTSSNNSTLTISHADQVASQTAVYAQNLEKQFLELHRALDLLRGGQSL